MQIRKAASLLVLLAAAPAGLADLIDFTGDAASSINKTGATFSGSLEYQHDEGEFGRLMVVMHNDTEGVLGGFLTGFLLRIGSVDPNASATLARASDPDFLDTGHDDGSPFGEFEAGAALGGNFLGNTPAVFGIPDRGVGTFEFLVHASDARSLSARDFLDRSVGIVVRFGMIAPDNAQDIVPSAVPAPAAAALLGLGGFAASRRRRDTSR